MDESRQVYIQHWKKGRKFDHAAYHDSLWRK